MDKRRSERMKAVLPIKIYGRDSRGNTYCDLAHTLDVGRAGARLGSMRRKVELGSLVVVQYRQRKAEFKIVWIKSLNGDKDQWIGLKPVEQKDPWGIPHSTPLVDHAELSFPKGTARTLTHAPESDTNAENEQLLSRSLRRARARMKTTACVCQPGREDVVNVVNMSREGLCFQSAREYVADTLVRVAVPYTPGVSNIFMIGRVAWVRTGSIEMNACGINYVKSYSRDDMAL